LHRADAASTGQWKVGTAKTRDGHLEGRLEGRLDGMKKKENSNVATPRSDA